MLNKSNKQDIKIIKENGNMKKDNNYWEPVYNMFFEDYPQLADKMIDWYPSGQLEITVKVEGGKKYVYDMMTRMAYSIRDEIEEELSEEEWRKNFSRNFNHKLRNISMTQDRLSELTGISQITISKYSNGKATPSSYNLRKIVKVLNCSIHELIHM